MSYDGKRCEDICKHAPPQKGKRPCEDCDMRYHDRAEKQTNADKIRSMSDEELAKTLCTMTNEGCPPWHDADISLCHNHGVCHDGECWEKWLKQESTNEST